MLSLWRRFGLGMRRLRDSVVYDKSVSTTCAPRPIIDGYRHELVKLGKIKHEKSG
jgi:hypothetical protein